MLNVGQLNEGFVLDHIEAGKSMMIYNNLGLGELDCQVAIIKNARSSKMGRKDIIKIEGGLDLVDLDVLGFIDHNITVNIIKDATSTAAMPRCSALIPPPASEGSASRPAPTAAHGRSIS